MSAIRIEQIICLQDKKRNPTFSRTCDSPAAGKKSGFPTHFFVLCTNDIDVYEFITYICEKPCHSYHLCSILVTLRSKYKLAICDGIFYDHYLGTNDR